MSATLLPDPVLPQVEMHIVRPTEPVRATVHSTRLCLKGKSASYIRHVEIDISDTPIAGRWRVGQSFGVVPPGVDEHGRPHKVRLYSIASPTRGEDGEGRILSTTPKRVIDERQPQRAGDDPDDHRLFLGVCSNHICDLRAGDDIMVAGPNGKSFLLPVDADGWNYVFVATGTGIAPFRGMALELLEGDRPHERPIHLLMGSPYTTDLLYDDLFTRLARDHASFHYHTAISREPLPGRTRGRYVDALFAELIDGPLGEVLAASNTLIYVCGLAGMQVGLFRALARAGLGGPFLHIKDEAVAAMSPDEWTEEQVKRHVRSTKRCMMEVY